MKVTLKEQPNIMKQNYPFLGITPKGSIVLFTKLNTGVCLQSREWSLVLGQYSDQWAMDLFELYNGAVTLEND